MEWEALRPCQLYRDVQIGGSACELSLQEGWPAGDGVPSEQTACNGEGRSAVYRASNTVHGGVVLACVPSGWRWV